MKLEAPLEFLKSLAENNSKEWMDANRDAYQDSRDLFVKFTEKIFESLISLDTEISGEDPRKSIFRINRDIRFSPDKSPYKRNFAFFIANGGKNGGMPGYYFHLQPGGKSFVAGGIYMPPAEKLNAIRQEIDYNPQPLIDFFSHPKVKENFVDLDRGAMLKRAPKGYSPDHPFIDWLRLKSFVISTPIPDKIFIKNDALEAVIPAFQIMVPFIQYLRMAID